MSKTVHATNLERIELERLRARVTRLLAAVEEAAELAPAQAAGAWLPPVDLCETCDAVIVCAELPGVGAEAVEVTLAGPHLRISGRRKRGATRGAVSHLCSERSYGQFSRVIQLRWPVRADGARAELKDGLLTVRLPKLKERRGGALRIPVEPAGGE